MACALGIEQDCNECRMCGNGKVKNYFISPDGALRLIESQPVAYDPQKVINAIDNAVPRLTNIQIMMICDIVKSGSVSDD